MSYAYGEKTRLILSALTGDPEISNAEVIKRVPGASVRFIADLRLAHGYLTKGIFACMSSENKAWVLSEAKRRGIGQGFVIDELVSKARMTCASEG